ncbi:hypothetical protein [Actinoplanes sp. G11-F43]
MAGALLNLFFGHSRRTEPPDATVSVEDLADPFLHGALSRTES